MTETQTTCIMPFQLETLIGESQMNLLL